MKITNCGQKKDHIQHDFHTTHIPLMWGSFISFYNPIPPSKYQ